MRRFGLVLGAAFFFAGAALVSGGRRFTRIAVSGHSMEPGLLDGDWLLIDTSETVFVQSDVVVARDPRVRGRLIVKRVGDEGTDFPLWLISDHPAHANEVIGPVLQEDLVGRVVFRYWPLSRVGPLD